MLIVGLIIGMVLGVVMGIVIIALVAAGKREEEQLEKLFFVWKNDKKRSFFLDSSEKQLEQKGDVL